MAELGDGVEKSFGSGLVGTVTVAGLHQVSRHLLRDAPRMDVWGERVIVETFRRIGRPPPQNTRMLSWMLGNIGSDTLLYAAVGLGNPKRPVLRGGLIGAAMGVGALVLPKLLGITDRDVARTTRTRVLTVGMYLIAGLAAGAAQHLARALEGEQAAPNS